MQDPVHDFLRRYELIMLSEVSNEARERLLADLMKQMEREFRLPSLQGVEEQRDRTVILGLYRMMAISCSRPQT